MWRRDVSDGLSSSAQTVSILENPTVFSIASTHAAFGPQQSVAIKVHAGAASADDFHFLARYELSKGRTAKGLAFAMLASREDDGCGACLETAAVAALKMGDLERAVRFQETAVRVVSEFDDEMPRMEATLATYRKRLFNARSATQRSATQPATGDAKPFGTP